MKASPVRRSIVVSFLLHAALLVAAYFFILKQPKQPVDSEKVKWIQLLNTASIGSSEKAAKVHSQQKKRFAQKRSSRASVDVRRLFALDGSGQPLGVASLGEGAGDAALYGHSSAQVANAIDLKRAVRIVPFMQALRAKIDEEVDYPSLLHESGQKGWVRCEFEVDRHGVQSGDFFGVEADNRYLKVHVLRKLAEALQQPLRGGIDGGFKRLRVLTVFRFGSAKERNQYGERERVHAPELVKNLMYFYRRGDAAGANLHVAVTGAGQTAQLGLGINFPGIDSLFSRDVRRSERPKDYEVLLRSYRDDPLF